MSSGVNSRRRRMDPGRRVHDLAGVARQQPGFLLMSLATKSAPAVDPRRPAFSMLKINATRHRQHAGRGPDGDLWVGNGATYSASHGSRWIDSTAFIVKWPTP